MRCVLIVIVIFCVSRIYAGVNEGYPCSAIPDSLKENAVAIVRFDDEKLAIRNLHKTVLTVEKVITVLKNSGKMLASVSLPYGGTSSIKSFHGWVYDCEGKVIKEYAEKDGIDLPDMQSLVLNLANSNRIKVWNMQQSEPPFTIKYTCEVESNQTFYAPPWFPVSGTEISIEDARYIVTFGKDISINFDANKISDTSTFGDDYFWEVKKFKAVTRDTFSVDYADMLPCVRVAPLAFELYGKKGSAASWSDIGSFVYSLVKGRDVLDRIDDPAANAILSAGKGDMDEVKALYRYLQNNYRYVNISLGIGGYQPQEASFTMQKKYGDCKALVTLMKALLAKAGIESYYALVFAGENNVRLKESFPQAVFNHVILCVPLHGDTTWLECTNQLFPPAYMGSFTGNRKALLVYEGGGKIISTPKYNENNNISFSSSLIQFTNNNITTVKASVTRYGALQEDLRLKNSLKDQKALESSVYSTLNLKNTVINSFTLARIDPDSPIVALHLDLSNENTIHKTESRLYVKTNVFSPIYAIPGRNENRIYPVNVSKGYSQSDTLVYQLPPGYVPENFKTGDDKTLTEKFGYANCIIRYDTVAGKLDIIRNFCQRRDSYPASQYGAFREFLIKASKTCCPELVLKKVE